VNVGLSLALCQLLVVAEALCMWGRWVCCVCCVTDNTCQSCVYTHCQISDWIKYVR